MGDPDEHQPGQVLLGKLEVIRRIGGGGMGVVYEVEHRLTGHRRALKVVRARYADRPRFMKRLLREAKVAGTLGTPHVVETYDAGRLEDGSAYILMELLEGRSLYEEMQARGTIEPERIASIMVQVAEGMTVAHGAGIVHRDLKPENIFLLRDEEGEERVKILDFGVSKFELNPRATRLTAEGTLVGTPYYMSPEQASGKSVDARTDVYAMGVMLYEALVGKLPYEAATVGELFVRIGSGECVPLATRRPDLDPAWFDIVHKAFHKDRAQRYQSAEELRRALLPLAAARLATRAKTISDGSETRGTLAYEEPVPGPPRAPSELIEARAATTAASSSRPPAAPPEEEDESGLVRSAPPPRPSRPPSRGSRAWLWGLAGAALVAAILIPWRFLGAPDTPAAPPPAASPGPAPVEEPSPAPAPIEDPAGEAPVAVVRPDAGVAEAAAPPPGRRRATPATNAGLDPNPYR